MMSVYCTTEFGWWRLMVIIEEDPVSEVVSSTIGYCRFFTDRLMAADFLGGVRISDIFPTIERDTNPVWFIC